MAKEASKNIRGANKPRWVIIVHILFVIALLVIIQIAVSNEWINRIFLSSPTQIWEELIYTIENNILWPHTLVSLQEVGLGYLISAVGGTLLGVLFVSFPKVEYLLSPIMSELLWQFQKQQ